MRTGRTGKTAYTYFYDGGLLTHMTCGNKTLHFTYSPTGSPVSVTYDGATYYYILSLQGDVMGLTDSSGQAVVAYVYDAWGRLLSTEGDMQFTLGLDNPSATVATSMTVRQGCTTSKADTIILLPADLSMLIAN